MRVRNAHGALPGWLNFDIVTREFWFMAKNGKGMTKVIIGPGATLHLEPAGKSVIHGLHCIGGDVGMRMDIDDWYKADYEMDEGEMGEGFSGGRPTPPMPEGPKK